MIADLLWSQPNIYKEEYPSTNSSSQFRKLNFTQDSLNKFLNENKLSMLIRSKDVCNSGFERGFNNKLITIFSATNYCNSLLNDGAILYVKRNLELQPKLMTADEQMNTWSGKKDINTLYPLSPRKKV